MNQKLIYRVPQADWSTFAVDAIICDSFEAQLDPYDFEEFEW